MSRLPNRPPTRYYRVRFTGGLPTVILMVVCALLVIFIPLAAILLVDNIEIYEYE